MMFIFTIILETSEALDPIMENAANSHPHGHLSLHTISFLLHVPSHRVSSRQNNLQCARGALGPCVCISEPLGPRDDTVNSQSKPGARFPSGLLTECVVRAQKSQTQERCLVMGATTSSTLHVITVI